MTAQNINYNTGSSPSWDAIFKQYDIGNHNFDIIPFQVSADQIKAATQHFKHTSEKEVRILCKQDARENRPLVFCEKGLFILPVKNGHYAIIKGEGYVDTPHITSPVQDYHSEFPFTLETATVGDSETQHLDRAYALSLIRHFVDDESLVLTIRGRKYTPEFNFIAGGFRIAVKGVQTEVDAGFEGRRQVVLVEAKKGNANNTIIRQLYYPFRQWSGYTSKPVSTLFFQRVNDRDYHIRQFVFDDPNNYNSIRLLKSGRYRIAK